MADTHLNCIICSYKQYDDSAISYFKSIYPDMLVHKIPYVCGACLDNMTDAQFEEYQRDLSLRKEESL